MIKISIIIPVYNAEQYLEQCLESVINQSLKEIEIICVNDGSIDNSLRILEECSRKDNRIIIINQENGGSSKARNSALQIAKGEYCLNIDSDDWIEQGYLEAMYEKAKKENLDILISDIYFDYNNFQKKKLKKDLEVADSKIITGKEYLQQFFTCNFLGYTWNKLIKRELYIKNNIKYNENIFMLEDVEVIGKLSYFATKIGKLNRAYYRYRLGENNGSWNNLTIKHITDTRECFQNLENFYIENNEKELVKLCIRKKNLRTIGMFFNGRFNLEEIKFTVLDEYLREIKKEEFIKQKYEDAAKDESVIKILLYNFIKIFNRKEIVLFLAKIIGKIYIFKVRRLKSE